MHLGRRANVEKVSHEKYAEMSWNLQVCMDKAQFISVALAGVWERDGVVRSRKGGHIQ